MSARPGSTADVFRKQNQLPRSLPEAQGMVSEGILNFLKAVETRKMHLHSLMLVRHGSVIAEGWWAPYRPELKHTLYSLSKSFTSTAVGLAVGEGRLKLDDAVVSFFPDEAPATPDPRLAGLKVKHLLTMTTGHTLSDAEIFPKLLSEPGGNWAKAFLALPIGNEPGTAFLYNSAATYMLGRLVQKLTGQSLVDYLTPRLFGPLGIRTPDWEVDPKGFSVGGWGLRLRTEDIARFGQLYLQKGIWNGKQILPKSWVSEATRAHIMQPRDPGAKRPPEQNDWVQGYGYQFWRCQHNAFRGDGAFGQFCVVMPEQDAVLAITAEQGDMQAVLDEVWTHLLPAMHAKPLPPDDLQKTVRQTLAGLAIRPPEAKNDSPLSRGISGKQFEIEQNTLKVSHFGLTLNPDSFAVTLRDDNGEHTIRGRMNRWQEGETTLSTLPLKLLPTPVPGETRTRIAASGTWTDDNTFVITCRFIETAHYDTLTCRFDGDRLQVTFRNGVARLQNRADTRPVLHGRLVAAR